MSDVDLSVVVVSWNTLELTRDCLASLCEDAGNHRRREIIVVDNGSQDGSADMVEREFPEVILVRNHDNRLYAEANNQGARRASGRFLCLLNSDTVVRPGALGRMVDFLEHHHEYGAVSPKLLSFDGSVQQACCRFPGLLVPLVESTSIRRLRLGGRVLGHCRMRDFDHLQSRDVEQPPAACMMMRRREFLDMGGLDPTLSLYFNDVDLCRRLWEAGRRIRYLADAEVFHYRGASTGGLDESWKNTVFFRNREAYYRKHHGFWGLVWLRAALLAHASEVAARVALGPQSGDRRRASLNHLRALVIDGFRASEPAPAVKAQAAMMV